MLLPPEGAKELGKAESRSIWVSDEINQIPVYFSPQKEIDFNLNCFSVLLPPSSATTATHSIHSTSFPQIFTPLKSCLFALVCSKGTWKKCLKKALSFWQNAPPFLIFFSNCFTFFFFQTFLLLFYLYRLIGVSTQHILTECSLPETTYQGFYS